MDESEASALVLGQKAHDRRTRVFSALLAEESGLGTEGMTVVGGSAIEIYTEGDYASDDLDLVVDSKVRVATVLKRWGFRNEGKLWTKRDWSIFPDQRSRGFDHQASSRIGRLAEPAGGVRRSHALGETYRGE